MKEWQKATCPICGETYEYLAEYKPATCPKFTCLQEGHKRGLNGVTLTKETKE